MKYILTILLFLLFQLASVAQSLLDPTFNGTGVVSNSYVLYDHDLAIQPDGKILIAGSGLSLVRYNPDGTIDNTFGNGGLAVHDFSNTNVNLSSLLVQDDGKILLGGLGLYSYPFEKLFVARLNANGSVDSSFGINGLVQTDTFTVLHCTPPTSVYYETGGQIALQPDGRIIQVGTYRTACSTGDAYFYANRYTSEGKIDTTFTYSPGFVFFSSLLGPLYSNGVLIRPDSTIIVYGSGNGVGADSLTVTPRFGVIPSDGHASLSGGGALPSPLASASNFSTEFMIPHNGSYIIGGSFEDGNKSKMAVARLKPSFWLVSSVEDLDTSFGTMGYTVASFPGDAEALDAEVLPDGKILLAGVSNSLGFSQDDITLVRLNADGTLDNSFGSNGIVTTDLSNGYESAYSLARQADGKIVVTGSSWQNLSGYTVVLRYTDQIQGVENPTANGFKVYPNPTSNMLRLELNEQKCFVTIMDLAGRTITNVETKNATELIDLSGYSSGTYLLELRSKDWVTTEKILKQ